MKPHKKRKWKKDINQNKQQKISILSSPESQDPTTSHHSRKESSVEKQHEHLNISNSNFIYPQQSQQYYNKQTTQYQLHHHDMLQFHNLHSDMIRIHSLLSFTSRPIFPPHIQINPNLHPQQLASQPVLRPTALYASLSSQQASQPVLRSTDFYASLKPQHASQAIFRPTDLYASLRSLQASQPFYRHTDLHSSLKPQWVSQCVSRPTRNASMRQQQAIMGHDQSCLSQKIPLRQSVISSNKLSSEDLEFIKKVYQQRKELRISQPELAKEINEISKFNWSKSDIQRFESGYWTETITLYLKHLLQKWIENNNERKRQPVKRNSNQQQLF